MELFEQRRWLQSFLDIDPWALPSDDDDEVMPSWGQRWLCRGLWVGGALLMLWVSGWAWPLLIGAGIGLLGLALMAIPSPVFW